MSAESLNQARNRLRFLHAVRDMNPEVFDTLRCQVLPAFRSSLRVPIHGSTQVGWKQITQPPLDRWSSLASSSDPDYQKAAHLISEWGERYHLTDEWILDRALEAILLWLTSPSLRTLQGEWILWSIYETEERLDPKRLQIDEIWCFEQEPWEQFERRITVKMEAYKSVVLEFCKRIGGEPASSKSNLRRFEWLALYQTQELSAEKVGKRYSVTKTHVEKATKELAVSIGLTLRSGRRGHPRRFPTETSASS
jgi:hypothetical protein